MRTRLRQFGLVGVVLVLTAVGFLVTRGLGELDARRDASHRADIAATQVRDRVAQAATLVDGVRRFLVEQDSSAVTTEPFADIGARWLGPVGLPAAAWIERVPAAERASYERRTGHAVVVPTSAGGLARAGPRRTYLPATLVTGSPPMSAPGSDLGGAAGLAAVVGRRQTAYRVSATPLGQLVDGTTGLFLAQSAQRLNRGVVEPGFVVLFLPSSWLLAGAADTGGPDPKLQITVGGGSAGDLGDAATARSTFAAAGQRFAVRVPLGGVQGVAGVLPWMVGGAGLLLAALAGALGVIAARRATAKAEVDRLFTLSPDMIVVAGFDGYFKRVNPAFETRLGYTQQEALSRPYVEFVHPDDRERTESRSRSLREGETTIAFENRYLCKDGSVRWIEWTSTPVRKERLIYAVARDVTERRQAERDLREAEERNRALAEEQAALRRVATLVARGVLSEEMFAAVTEEVGQLLPVTSAAMGRCDPDGMFATVAAWSTGTVAFPPGKRWLPEGKNVMTMVVETGRPARIDDFSDASGPVGVAAREAGYRSAVGTPIIVEDRLWGVMTAASSAEEPLPADIEKRLASFTELVATAIANTESRAELRQLADEQAALRRVATLVAEGVQPAELFSAVSQEVAGLFDSGAGVLTYDHDRPAIVFVGAANVEIPIGTRWELQEGMASAEVYRTGRPARVDSMDWSAASGPVAATARRVGVRSTVASPIVVEGRLWGAITISSPDELLPPDAEERLENFTELTATAIANAESRSELAASRARIVAASDEARRRIERDLHDGTQQRLVSLSLELRLAESVASADFEEPRRTLGRVAGELVGVIDELREISRGIHPAILSEGGLGPALRTLARRSATPVALGSVIDQRLPEAIEVAAYFVVSEALANATKHANASEVDVEATARDGNLWLWIRDDGVGGADPAGGSGLVGLRDRVEALGGSIEINSPSGQGTQVAVRLPLDLDVADDELTTSGRPEGRHIAPSVPRPTP